MTKHVLGSGVGEKLWSKLIRNPAKWPHERIMFVRRFLIDLKKTEWQEIEYIKNQFCATDEMWDNMTLLFDEVEFPEQKRLFEARKRLKAKWIAFKQDYKDLIESLRSDGTS